MLVYQLAGEKYLLLKFNNQQKKHFSTNYTFNIVRDFTQRPNTEKDHT